MKLTPELFVRVICAIAPLPQSLVSFTVPVTLLSSDGAVVGAVVGATVGATVGSVVGATVGACVGATVGSTVGAIVGAAVGSTVGSGVSLPLPAMESFTIFPPFHTDRQRYDTLELSLIFKDAFSSLTVYTLVIFSAALPAAE